MEGKPAPDKSATPKAPRKPRAARAPKPETPVEAAEPKQKEAPDPSRELTDAFRAAGALVVSASAKRIRDVFDGLLGALEDGDKKPKKRQKG